MGNMNYRDLWEIHQGVFVPFRPEYSHFNPYQRKAKVAGDLLVEHFDCSGVFLRGSGINLHVDYQLEDLIGVEVVVLSNLKPRFMKGFESQGMILMVKDSQGKLKFITPDSFFKSKPGQRIY